MLSSFRIDVCQVVFYVQCKVWMRKACNYKNVCLGFHIQESSLLGLISQTEPMKNTYSYGYAIKKGLVVLAN